MRIREISAESLNLVARYSSHIYQSGRLSVSVKRGDVIGYYQPESNQNRFSLYYQSDSGFGSWRKSNERSAPGTFRMTGRGVESGIEDFPLLRVEAGIYTHYHC